MAIYWCCESHVELLNHVVISRSGVGEPWNHQGSEPCMYQVPFPSTLSEYTLTNTIEFKTIFFYINFFIYVSETLSGIWKAKPLEDQDTKIYFTLKIMEKSLHFTVKVFKSRLLMNIISFFRSAVSKYIYFSNTRISPTEQNFTTNLEICLIHSWQNSREVSP